MDEEVESIKVGRRRPCKRWAGSYGGRYVEVMRASENV